jgi:outer membrane receptor protein involved in Fe transport
MRKLFFLSLFAISLLVGQTCWAQSSNQGALIGTITDEKGAIIPGVSLTLTNIDTGSVRNSQTNDQGDYRIDFLQPAKYRIVAELTGFKKSQTDDINLQVGQLLRIDLTLQVGAVSEAVTISSTDSASLNTETPVLGQVIGQAAIENMPLNGREFIQLAALVPGAQSGNPLGEGASKGYVIAFNGNRGTQNSYFVDGADSSDMLYNTLVTSPSLDAIKEFRVDTSSFSAQYGRAGGGVVSAITKSGTNDFHGSIFEYNRNRALDALPAFFTGARKDVQSYRYNQFGGSIGGPVVLPTFGEGNRWFKVLRNKTFFFYSPERLRASAPGRRFLSIVPTALERVGDVSQTRNPYNGQPVILINPYTREVIPSGKLPQNLISPVGQTLMDLWPKPNYSGDPVFNYQVFRSGKRDIEKNTVRIDHQFSDRDTLYGSFNWSKYVTLIPDIDQYGDYQISQEDHTFAATYTHSFSTSLVNDFKLSNTRYVEFTGSALADKSYGIEWGFWPDVNGAVGSPRVFFWVGSRMYPLGFGGAYTHQNRTLYIKDTAVWVKGAHTLAFGGDIRRQQYNWLYNNGSTNPGFGFRDGQPGREPFWITGSVFTSVLAGIPTYANVYKGGSDYMKFKRNAIALFLQDNWKATPRLSLNLGLRYDYEAPFHVPDGRIVTIDYDQALPVFGKGAPADVLANLTYRYLTDGPTSPFKANKSNFAPRVGFAYQPFADGKTVIRGGYGIFYDSTDAFTTTYGSWTGPFGGELTWSPFSGIFGIQYPDQSSRISKISEPFKGLDYLIGRSLGAYLPVAEDYPESYVQQWNMTLSRRLPMRLLGEVSYVGNKGTNLNGLIPWQVYDLALYNRIRQNIPSLSGSLWAKGRDSRYNALQASLRRDFSKGLYFQAAYTFGKDTAEASYEGNYDNTVLDTDPQGRSTASLPNSLAGQDVRQRFSIAGGWQVPFGRGQKFGSDLNKVVNTVLGGWNISVIGQLQSGFPYTVLSPTGNLPDRICDGRLPSNQRTVDRWIDIKCFPDHQPKTAIDPVTGVTTTYDLQGNAGRNIIPGPGTNLWDIGIHKNFNFKERVRVQVRGELFNAFNHPNYVGHVFNNNVSGAKITSAQTMRQVQLALRFEF